MFVFGDASVKNALCVRSEVALQHYELLAGEWVPSEPIMFLPHLGRIPTDLVSASSAMVSLISEKFRRILVEHSISGWRTFPAEVYGADGKLLPGYHGLAIAGRCGEIDETKSRLTNVKLPGMVRPMRMITGMFFVPESWDGSDIFLSPGKGFKFCTERVAEIIKEAKITNVRLTLASEYQRPFLEKAEAKGPAIEGKA